MGVLWGINRSMARIQAFILLSDEPVDLETVSTHLNISRGNASMSLKELRNWGVIQRVHVSGDRRDFYVTEPDVWKMLYRIAIERKKRDFDPALDALRHVLSETDIGKGEKVHERLIHLESTLATFDKLMTKFLENEKKSKTENMVEHQEGSGHVDAAIKGRKPIVLAEMLGSCGQHQKNHGREENGLPTSLG